MHVSFQELFRCEKCGRVFTTEGAMFNHKQRHKQEGTQKRHTCHICPYSTNYSSHLRQHSFTHTGERPYKCTQCTAGFTQNSLLKKHMQTHESKETKQMKCERCSKSFEDEKLYSKHVKMHKRKDKPYKCSVCNKRFSKESYSQKHEKKHARLLKFIKSDNDS